MNYEQSHASRVELPEPLRRAVASKELIIFCGAGISMLAPSNLPSWWSFNEAILEGIKSATLDGFSGFSETARAAISGLRLERFNVETFSEKVVATIAGKSYFPLLEVLESDKTNANHWAIAELGRSGCLRAIVTTNFDTLIERAFRQHGLALRVTASRADLPTSISSDCVLFKIHGSVSANSTIVDTVGQKLRGLPLATRAVLAELFRRYHVLVLGFSGADLNFGDDYLAFSTIDSRGPGITWVTRPGSKISPRVADVVRAAGPAGAVIEAALPDFFVQLGITKVMPSGIAVNDEREDAKTKMEERIRAFVAEPHIGPFGAAAICLRLISEIGDDKGADALYEAFANYLEMARPVPLPVGALLLQLGSLAMRRRNFVEAEQWQERGRAITQMIADEQLKAPAAWSQESIIETRKNLAGALNNLAVCSIEQGKFEQAQSKLQEAEKLAHQVDDNRILCRVLTTSAQLANKTLKSADVVLERLRRARAFAREAGESATLAETALLEAETFISVFELDSALHSLKEGRHYFRLEGNLAHAVLASKHLSTIACFRKKNAVGLRILGVMRRKCVRENAKAFAEFLMDHAVSLFSPFKDIRQKLLAEIENHAGFSERRDVWEKLRLALISGEFDGPLEIRVRSFGLGEREVKLRELLVKCELECRGDLVMELLQKLSSTKYDEHQFSRVEDLARSLYRRSRRAGSYEMHLSALNYLGIAAEMLGKLDAARTHYLEALHFPVSPSDELGAFLKHNLALVEMRLGNLDLAETLLNEALTSNSNMCDYNSASNNVRSLALIEIRRGNPTKAIAVLDSFAGMIAKADNPAISPSIAALRTDFERKRSTPPPKPVGELPPQDSSVMSAEVLRSLIPTMTKPEELGNLGLAALQSGLLDDALELFSRAEDGYSTNQNPLGLSRCLSNRADVALRRNQWTAAADLLERSIAIRREIGDIDGQIINGASLALAHLNNGDNELGITVGRRVITLCSDRKPGIALLKAYFAVVIGHARQSEEIEAIDAAQQFLRLFPAVDSGEEFSPMLPYIREIAGIRFSHAESGVEFSSFTEAVNEAERLQRSGRWREAIDILDTIDTSKLGSQDLGCMLATRGNVWQTAGEIDRSIEAYAEAATHFRSAGCNQLAAQADHHRAVSLRKSGNVAEAESVLRGLLSNAPNDRLRAHAAVSLANLIVSDLVENPDLTLLAEASTLLDHARSLKDLDDEDRGIIEAADSNVAWLADDFDRCLTLSERARSHYLRCNSRHLDNFEIVLAERRDAISKSRALDVRE